MAGGSPVIPVFILDDSRGVQWQLGSASQWWLHHSLETLSASLEKLGSRLILRRGAPDDVLAELAKETNAGAVHWTRCYEPAARALDDTVQTVLKTQNVSCKRFAGSLIFEPEEIATGSGTPYKVFTPFWRACLAKANGVKTLQVPKSLPSPKNWPKSETLNDWTLRPTKPEWSTGFAKLWTPGEAGAHDKLKTFLDGPVTSYATDRDRPDRAGTSQLSPHLHFGEISPRQVWSATRHAAARSGDENGAAKFLAEIGWREFSHHLLYHWPTLPEAPFRPEYSEFPWDRNAANLKAWQSGQTGYPIVDAGMRQLWQTGWMHNRVRMIVASFLIKHLRQPWQDGETWFWDTLVDANLASNAAGWQWVAGSGADASPYFRIFNPITQGKKFDPDGAYVREFVPELSEMPNKFIHDPWMADQITLRAAGVLLGETYPEPIVDHAAARARALEGYAQVKGKSGG